MRLMEKKPLKDQVLLDAPMPIETPRLLLRPLQEGDGAALNEAKLETWNSLSKVFSWATGTPDPDNDEIYARKAQADYVLRRDFSLVGLDKKTGQPVAYTGIHCHDWNLREFQIGYWVRESEQGKGYATETANALIRYAFNVLGANRLSMCHVDGNVRSGHIIQKLGFDYEGVRRNSLYFAGGQIKDAHWYSRINDKKLPTLKVKWG